MKDDRLLGVEKRRKMEAEWANQLVRQVKKKFTDPRMNASGGVTALRR